MAGRSGGGPGLPARRPGAAGPGEWEGWGKGRGLSPLEIHSYTPLATCRASAALETPGSLGSPSWGRVPGGFPRQLRPTSGLPIPRVSGTPPSPRCRGARAPSQAPQCLPPLYIPGVSASAPQVLLSSPGFPPILTPPHTRSPLLRGSTSGLSPMRQFFKGSPWPTPLPDLSLLLVWREQRRDWGQDPWLGY